MTTNTGALLAGQAGWQADGLVPSTNHALSMVIALKRVGVRALTSPGGLGVMKKVIRVKYICDYQYFGPPG